MAERFGRPRFRQRPDTFSLDYRHPLSRKLWMACLGNDPGQPSVFDSSPWRRHFTPQNMEGVDWQYGIGRLALDLDGTNEYLSITGQPSFTNNTPFSISIFVNADDISNFEMLQKRTGTSGTIVEYRFGTVGAAADTFGGFVYETSTIYIGRKYNTAITSLQGSWHHFAMTYDGGTTTAAIRLFIDGLRVDDTDQTGGTFSSIQDQSAELKAGNFQSNYSNGRIADQIVWSRALSDAEIRQIADIGDPSICGLILPPKRVFWPGARAAGGFAGKSIIVGSGIVG